MGPNPTEFAAIYDKFRSEILRYLTTMVGEYEAEDLTQEVFVKVNRGLPGFRGDAKVSTWVYRIATNTALDQPRRTSPGPRAAAEQPLSNLAESDDQGEIGPPLTYRDALPTDLHVIRREMTDCVRSYIRRLPQDLRVVLALSEYEGLSNQEIARILGISLDNVKIR